MDARAQGHREWLQPEEEVLHVMGRHPLSVVDGILGSMLFVAVLIGAVWAFAITLLPELRPFALPITLLLVLGWAVGLLAFYWRVRTSRYVVTADRVYRGHGRLRFTLSQTTYDKVTDMQVTQSLFGRIWGFGTVIVQTAGTGLAMQGVHDPFEMKRRIEASRRTFLARLLEAHGVRRAKAETVAPRAEGEAATEGTAEPSWVPVDGGTPERVLWRGGPVAYTMIPAFLSGFGVGAVGLMLTLSALAGDRSGPFTFIGPLMLLFAVSTMAQAVIQYRYTRYEVQPWGVVVTSGWLSRRRIETTFEKVTDVATYQGVFARLLDYGNIKINTAGSNQAPVNFNGLAQPERVKELIDEARRRTDRDRRS